MSNFIGSLLSDYGCYLNSDFIFGKLMKKYLYGILIVRSKFLIFNEIFNSEYLYMLITQWLWLLAQFRFHVYKGYEKVAIWLIYSRNKILIFFKDCTFCRLWVEYYSVNKRPGSNLTVDLKLLHICLYLKVLSDLLYLL